MIARDYLQADSQELVYGFDETLTEADFDPYQHWMVKCLVDHKRVLLGAFMGSGKTACALNAALKVLRTGEVGKWLVVAPLRVAANTWPDEALAWDFARDLEYSVIVGTPEQRIAAIEKDADIYFINRENYRWLVKQTGKHGWKWDGLIYDEASRLSGGEEKTKPNVRKDGSESKPRRSEFGYITGTNLMFNRVWLLSGTPATEGIIDLWGPMFVIDGGAALGKKKQQFLGRWFDYNKYSYTYTPYDHSEEEITERVKGKMFVLREEDYLDLPPVVIKDRLVRLPDEAMRAYRRFERELYLEEYDVEAVNNGVLANKLLQFANGSVYAEADAPANPEDEPDLRGKSVAKWVHDAKLDELDSIFAEAGGRPLLIAYSYKFDAQAIKKRFPYVRIFGEGKNDVRDWNAGKFKGMMMHPASAGHGLNFQKGSSIAVWYGLNWSLELYQQFNKRLARRGQKAAEVWLYRILARGTRDLTVAEALETKGATQDRVTEPFRVRPEDLRVAA